MVEQNAVDFDRIAHAIAYIRAHYKEQPDLNTLAAELNLSPFHFQRLFSDWAGVSPKSFLQFISIDHARHLLKMNATLSETSAETGLSGSGRLHDLFVKIEGMTPGDFKNGADKLAINFSFSPTPFGKVIIASTPKGICHMSFNTDETVALTALKEKFPNAQYNLKTDNNQNMALGIFRQDWTRGQELKLHLKGSPFQLKIWELLLKIPSGSLSTYGSIANEAGSPAASRAVGTAIGSNPVAFLIPCHRVIRAGGEPGGYMWGIDRKMAMIGWEASREHCEFPESNSHLL